MSKSSLKLSVMAAALADDPRLAPRIAQRLGFTGMGLAAFSSSLDLTTLSLTGRRELRQVLSGQNQDLAGIWVDLGVKGFTIGADVDRELARLDKVLEIARGLAAPLVCVDLGPLPPAPAVIRLKPAVTSQMAGFLLLPESATTAPPEPTTPPSTVDPAFVSQVDAALFDLGQRADRYGVVIAFRSDLAGFSALDRALHSANCPWFGVDLDPVALLRDDWDIDQVFSALGGSIRHVRGRDAVAGAERRTKPTIIGRGNTDWVQLLARLDEAGFHGWITVDPMELPDRIAAAEAGRQHIAKVM